jgi:chaperonin GroES
MTQLKPLKDRVLVQPKAVNNLTPGGLHIPEQAKERPVQGTVLAVGPGCVTPTGQVIPMTVVVGDTVMYGARMQVKKSSLMVKN